MGSVLRVFVMAGRNYSDQPLVIDRISVICNPSGIHRGLQCVGERSKRSMWLPLGADAYFLFKDGYFGQEDPELIMWDDVIPGWTAEMKSEINLWLVTDRMLFFLRLLFCLH